jgi:hypothetical protein
MVAAMFCGERLEMALAQSAQAGPPPEDEREWGDGGQGQGFGRVYRVRNKV